MDDLKKLWGGVLILVVLAFVLNSCSVKERLEIYSSDWMLY